MGHPGWWQGYGRDWTSGSVALAAQETSEAWKETSGSPTALEIWIELVRLWGGGQWSCIGIFF